MLFRCRESWRTKKDNAKAAMEICQERLAENVAKTTKVFVCHTSLESRRKNNGKKNIKMLRYSSDAYAADKYFSDFLVCKTIGKCMLPTYPTTLYKHLCSISGFIYLYTLQLCKNIKLQNWPDINLCTLYETLVYCTSQSLTMSIFLEFHRDTWWKNGKKACHQKST